MSINTNYQHLMQEINKLKSELSSPDQLDWNTFYHQKQQIENDMAAFYGNSQVPQSMKNQINAAIQELPDPMSGPNANLYQEIAGLQSLSQIESQQTSG